MGSLINSMLIKSRISHPNLLDYENGGRNLFLKNSCLDNGGHYNRLLPIEGSIDRDRFGDFGQLLRDFLVELRSDDEIRIQCDDFFQIRLIPQVDYSSVPEKIRSSICLPP
jgi:hypothetical protein